MNKEDWAVKFSDNNIFCTCDCHGAPKLKHPACCFFCSELHKPENYPKTKEVAG